MPIIRSLFNVEQFRTVLQRIAHKIAIEAITNLHGEVRVIAHGSRLDTVETDKHLIRFFASHISYSEHDTHRWEHSWGFDVEEKLYSVSNHSTKISFYAPEGKEKEVTEKVTKFIDELMAESAIKPVPRFSLSQLTQGKH